MQTNDVALRVCGTAEDYARMCLDMGTRIEALSAENKRLRTFAEFALKWCDRGPPHGGPGNEVQALDFIRHHPVLSAMRQAAK